MYTVSYRQHTTRPQFSLGPQCLQYQFLYKVFKVHPSKPSPNPNSFIKPTQTPLSSCGNSHVNLGTKIQRRLPPERCEHSNDSHCRGGRHSAGQQRRLSAVSLHSGIPDQHPRATTLHTVPRGLRVEQHIFYLWKSYNLVGKTQGRQEESQVLRNKCCLNECVNNTNHNETVCD